MDKRYIEIDIVEFEKQLQAIKQKKLLSEEKLASMIGVTRMSFWNAIKKGQVQTKTLKKYLKIFNKEIILNFKK